MQRAMRIQWIRRDFARFTVCSADVNSTRTSDSGSLAYGPNYHDKTNLNSGDFVTQQSAEVNIIATMPCWMTQLPRMAQPQNRPKLQGAIIFLDLL